MKMRTCKDATQLMSERYERTLSLRELLSLNVKHVARASEAPYETAALESAGWPVVTPAAAHAVYLDAGFEAAAALVRRLYSDLELNAQMSAMGKDPKTELQEWLQARKMKLPVYRVVATLGEAHQQTFDVECTVTETGRSERGIGASRRAGEQAAAAAMLQHLTADPKQAQASPSATTDVAPSAKVP